LADSMPTARKKEEVPRWFILAANLSLKLHPENSFLAFERVVRCGGLLSALPPDLAPSIWMPKPGNGRCAARNSTLRTARTGPPLATKTRCARPSRM
jgi:hypothetical protein